MAARNTATEIAVIWEPPSQNFLPLMEKIAELANRYVNNRIQGKTCLDSGSAITEAELKDVELFLTCYFLSTRKPDIAGGNIIGVSVTKSGNVGFAGMMGNHYGQMAIELDCTGILRDLAARAQAAAAGNVNDQGPSEFSLLSDADLSLLPEGES